jgi:hypothetical protein
MAQIWFIACTLKSWQVKNIFPVGGFTLEEVSWGVKGVAVLGIGVGRSNAGVGGASSGVALAGTGLTPSGVEAASVASRFVVGVGDSIPKLHARMTSTHPSQKISLLFMLPPQNKERLIFTSGAFWFG